MTDEKDNSSGLITSESRSLRPRSAALVRRGLEHIAKIKPLHQEESQDDSTSTSRNSPLYNRHMRMMMKYLVKRSKARRQDSSRSSKTEIAQELEDLGQHLDEVEEQANRDEHWKAARANDPLYQETTYEHRKANRLALYDAWLKEGREGLEKALPSSPKLPREYSRSDLEIKSLGMEFILIPEGRFKMGSDAKEDEKPIHKVTIGKAFYMGRHPVTQSEWQKVMGTNPSKSKGDRKPVHCVSWEDAQEFIAKLNNLDSLFRYRLPSEAEWEYACRAGTLGDYAGDLDSMACYGGVDLEPVCTKKPNAFGLFDMHGGVLEWCEDRYHANYRGAPSDGTPWLSGGKVAEEMNRVARGGSFGSVGSYCRSATRNGVAPLSRGIVLGCRIVAASARTF